MRVIVTGGNDFAQPRMLDVALRALRDVGEWKIDWLVTGGEPGVDFYAEEWASKNGLSHVRILTGIDELDAAHRNTAMVNQADAALIFWDGIDESTRDLINKARAKALKIQVVHYRGVPS